MSLGGHTATAGVTKASKYQSVESDFVYDSMETGVFAVRVSNASNPMLVGIAEDGLPTNRYKSKSNSSGFIGWSSVFPYNDRVLGKRLRQPWLVGDKVRFIMDFTKHQIRAKHMRSGEKAALAFVPNTNYVIRAELMDGSSITFIE